MTRSRSTAKAYDVILLASNAKIFVALATCVTLSCLVRLDLSQNTPWMDHCTWQCESVESFGKSLRALFLQVTHFPSDRPNMWEFLSIWSTEASHPWGWNVFIHGRREACTKASERHFRGD